MRHFLQILPFGKYKVLLAALPKTSRFRAIINALAIGQIELVVSTAILLEYQEILSRKTNAPVANNFLEFLTKLPGIIRVDTLFTWGIVLTPFYEPVSIGV